MWSIATPRGALRPLRRSIRDPRGALRSLRGPIRLYMELEYPGRVLSTPRGSPLLPQRAHVIGKCEFGKDSEPSQDVISKEYCLGQVSGLEDATFVLAIASAIHPEAVFSPAGQSLSCIWLRSVCCPIGGRFSTCEFSPQAGDRPRELKYAPRGEAVLHGEGTSSTRE